MKAIRFIVVAVIMAVCALLVIAAAGGILWMLYLFANMMASVL